MRIKYKGPSQFFFRRFWRVVTWTQHADGSFTAVNKAGKKLFLPPDVVVVVVGDKK